MNCRRKAVLNCNEMRLRKLLRFRNLFWLVCFVACASLLLLNGFVGISKTTSKTDFQAPQNHKVQADIVPKRSSNIAIKAYMKNLDTSESERKELPKERTLSELNLQQSKLFQVSVFNYFLCFIGFLTRGQLSLEFVSVFANATKCKRKIEKNLL